MRIKILGFSKGNLVETNVTPLYFLRYFTHTYIHKIEKQRSMDSSDPFRFEFKILSSAMQNVAKRTRYEQFGRS